MYTVNENYRLKRIAQLAAGASNVIDVGFADMPNPFLGNKTIIGVDPGATVVPENYTGIFKGVLSDYMSSGADAPDILIAGELLEHLENPIAFLRESYATLREGGKIIISTPNPNSPIERLLTITLNKKLFYTSDHLMLFPQRWLIRMLEYSNFQNVELFSGGFPVPGIGTVPFFRTWCHQTIAVAEK